MASRPLAPSEFASSASGAASPGGRPPGPPDDGSRGGGEAGPAVLYVGTADSVEEDLARRYGIPFRAIQSGQIRGMAPWVAARNLGKVALGVAQSFQVLRRFRPDVVLVTGGFVAAPVVWAAWSARVPVVIYLPDVEPGIAIRRLSRFATRVAVTFPEVAAHFPGKAVVTGYPVRRRFLEMAGRQAEARGALGLEPDGRVLLVFGGSRGARSINQALWAALPALLETCQVVHITGSLDWPEVEAHVRRLPEALRSRYRPYPYLHEEMPSAMAAADLVVARAGASTLGEFPALGLPSVLVPYPYSGQHQDANADYLVQRQAAIKIPDSRLATDLLPTVLALWESPERLAAMAAAARRLARPDAAAQIGRVIDELVSRR
ncbi:MAG: UDP-N-acetylglucosamine--N-acetylmuramyl-(pentapeptide) pyrophosphoryl-undecaprenol N-acetylglucosamine transferase [Caldilineales bacterium]|nr:UDP-N-acetylglucosamine--N-acetylmuramyl-(pentapeptide) pyrophosphoryl-undecaprenol N-acetylglucosamine transferase [Caldilineales bacterium]MDW8316299.1 UDP-N-acetylglucosamine--N-acetylmuramyl-(pentapeptide) pyrophosphoryl-undecaprenol N-acetylglucosamine transferase [Anaerolineae bacterium]